MQDKPVSSYEPPRAMRVGDARAGAGQGNEYYCDTPGSGNAEGCTTPGNSAPGQGCGSPGNTAVDDACWGPGNSASYACLNPGSTGEPRGI